MQIRHPLLPLLEYQKIQDDPTIPLLFHQAYRTQYIEKSQFSLEFYIALYDHFLQHLTKDDTKLTSKQFDSLFGDNYPNIPMEYLLILLHQSTELIQLFPQQALYFKVNYITLMEYTKQILYEKQNLALIWVCIEQLVNGKLLQSNNDINVVQNIQEKDTQYIIELMTHISDDLDMPLNSAQQILNEMFSINQHRNYNISRIIFSNLHDILRFNCTYTYTAIQGIRIFLKQRDPTVISQIKEFLQSTSDYFEIDEICSKLIFQILNSILTHCIFDPSFNNLLVEDIIQCFQLLWQEMQNKTSNQLYEIKTEFWLSFIHTLNLVINPIATTPIRKISEYQMCAALYLLLIDHKTLFKQNYIITHNIILHFIDSLVPISKELLQTNLIMQILIELCVEFTLNGSLKDNEGILETVNKTLKMVINLNMNQKQRVFQLIWAHWNPEETFYLKILQSVISNFLSGEDDNFSHLGTRNNFFYSILAMETQKKVIHPKKFHTLLQICQYLCLEDAVIDIEQIFQQNDSYSNIFYLKSHKIKKSFQEFFQVNQYFHMIVTLVENINNNTNLFYILKEFIKLIWLLTEGLKVDQVEFLGEFQYFIMRKLDQLSYEWQKELQDLLVDCSTSMVSRFIRHQLPNECLSEVLILNQFNLNILVNVYLLSDCAEQKLQQRCLKYLICLIKDNSYNQQTFRETICLSEILNKQRKCVDPLISDLYEQLIKKAMQFVLTDSMQEIIKKESQDQLQQKLNKQKTFRQYALSQYVGATLEAFSQQQNVTAPKQKRQLQFLGKDSGIIFRNFHDLTKKEWKSFTVVIEFKLQGFNFVNLNCTSQNNILKKEQILFQITTHQGDNQFDFLVLSLLQSNHFNVQLLDEKGMMKSFDFSFNNIEKNQTTLLRLTYDDKNKGKFIISHRDQSFTFSDKLQIKDFYKKQSNQKCTLNLAVGTYFMNNKQKMDYNRTFQGILNNFILLDGLIFQQLYDLMLVDYYEKNGSIIEFFDNQLSKMQIESMENDLFRSIQYLDIDKFKTAPQMMEIKDAIKQIRIIEKVNDNNFFVNMIKKSVCYKVIQEPNSLVKTYYQGLNCIENSSLAEIFLSSENIEIIMFMLMLTNQTYISHCLQKTCSRQGIHYSHKNQEKGVYKIKHFYDKQMRKLILVKDYRKNAEDYINCQQFQTKIQAKNNNCSIASQGESPGQQRQNFLNIESQVSITFAQPSICKDQIDIIPERKSTLFFTPDPAHSCDQPPKCVSAFPIAPAFSQSDLPLVITTFKNQQNDMATEMKSATFKRRDQKQKTHTYNYSPPVQPRSFDVTSQKVIMKTNNLPLLAIKHKKPHFKAEWIRVKAQYYGKLLIIEKKKIIKFKSQGEERPEDPYYQFGTVTNNLKLIKKVKFISISSIEEIQTRRYSLKEIAVEIFCRNQKVYFFNLYSNESQLKFIHQLKQINPTITTVIDRRQAFSQSDFQKKWLNNQLSNFEYLMQVNKFSGRSFNDLNQYPIFPWVIADYTSKNIDLKNPAIYRDLDKCIGAINKDRLSDCKYKAESLMQTNNEYFLYGCHYSVAAQIINTMVRVEPFTTLQTELQDGKLDQPDRIFFSIPNLWESCQNDQQDFRELIPEFFYFPEFLQNINNVAFGNRQNNEPVNDVELPPWASTPEQFIQINREALESDFVTFKLHSWINLIFGIHQQGEEAKKKENLFHWLTYESCWQFLEKCSKDDVQAYISQIQAFGQTPFQLFTKPHWRKDQHRNQLYTSEALIDILTKSHMEEPKKIIRFDKRPTIKLHKVGNQIYCILSNKLVYKIPYSGQFDEKIGEKPLINLSEVDKIHFETIVIQNEQSSPNIPRRQSISQNNAFVTGEQFVFDEDFQLFVAGYISGNVYCYNLQNNASIVKVIKLHKKRVTCLAYSQKLKTLCLGAKDHRVTVWKLQSMGDKTQLYTNPRFILYGHEKTVKCVRIDEITETIVSIDKGGIIMIHSIKSGIFLREIKFKMKFNEKIRKIEVDSDGLIVCLTNFSEILVTKLSGVKIQRYYYKSVGEISQIAFYLKKHILMSTYKGELLLMEDVHIMSEHHPRIFHIYQNKNNTSILNFTYFTENDQSLVFLLSTMDGSILRYSIHTEQVKPFLNYLEKLGYMQ